jgi:hypothetical protein
MSSFWIGIVSTVIGALVGGGIMVNSMVAVVRKKKTEGRNSRRIQ